MTEIVGAGLVIVFGCVGWSLAIVERMRLHAERQWRRHDADVYEGEIRSLRQQMFTAKIRQSVEQGHQVREQTVVVPRDGWVAVDRGTRH